jgi:hypothetical protein
MLKEGRPLKINHLKLETMNTKQESKFSMGLALRDFLNQNATTTSTLPGFGNLLTAFSENMDKIQAIREKQEADKTGITLVKEQTKSNLILKTLDISRRIGAYAKMTTQAVLASEVSYTDSDIKMASGNMLKDRALLIYDRASEHLQSISEYGVSAELLAELKSAIDQFIAAIPKPRLGISDRKQATSKLAELFSVSDALLEKLDLLVKMVMISQPEFYATYWNVRRVIENGRGSIALRAMVTDASTREGIRGVKVSLTLQNGNVKISSEKASINMVKTTASKGIFLIRSMHPGTWTATLAKPGFKEQVVTVTVAEKELTNLNVEMERN